MSCNSEASMESVISLLQALADGQRRISEQMSSLASRSDRLQAHIGEVDEKVSLVVRTLERAGRGHETRDGDAPAANSCNAVSRFFSRVCSQAPPAQPTPEMTARQTLLVNDFSQQPLREVPSAWGALGDPLGIRTPCINDFSVLNLGATSSENQDDEDDDQAEAVRHTFCCPEIERGNDDGGGARTRVRASTSLGRLTTSGADGLADMRAAPRPRGASRVRPRVRRARAVQVAAASAVGPHELLGTTDAKPALVPEGGLEATTAIAESAPAGGLEAPAASAEPAPEGGLEVASPKIAKQGARRPVRSRHVTDPLPSSDRADETVTPFLNKEMLGLLQERIAERETDK